MWTHRQITAALIAALVLSITGCRSAPGADSGLAPAAVQSGTEAAPAATTAVGTPSTAGAGSATRAPAQAEPTHPPTSGLVKGTVTDQAGAPVASAAIAVVAGTGPYPEMAVFTAADGSYLWMLGPGTYTLEANRDGFAPVSAEVTLEAGQEVKLDLTLAPE